MAKWTKKQIQEAIKICQIAALNPSFSCCDVSYQCRDTDMEFSDKSHNLAWRAHAYSVNRDSIYGENLSLDWARTAQNLANGFAKLLEGSCLPPTSDIPAYWRED